MNPDRRERPRRKKTPAFDRTLESRSDDMVGIASRILHTGSGLVGHGGFLNRVRLAVRPLSQHVPGISFVAAKHNVAECLRYNIAQVNHGLTARLKSVTPPAPQRRKMSLPPFDRSLGSKYTGPPNPTWSWCQKIDSTPDGQEWMEGEKQGWKTVATAEEDPT